MKFFIVDNGSLYLEHIIAIITNNGHDFFVQKYSPYQSLDSKDADVIILSGGMQNEVADDLENGDPWYRHEFDLIKNTNKPILGICLGLQMINVALGGSLRKLDTMVEENKLIICTQKGQELLNTDSLFVHERHQWGIDNYSLTGLQVLAKSDDGIEIMYNPTLKIIATQFHPEIDTANDNNRLFWNLIDVIMIGSRAKVEN